MNGSDIAKGGSQNAQGKMECEGFKSDICMEQGLKLNKGKMKRNVQDDGGAGSANLLQLTANLLMLFS